MQVFLQGQLLGIESFLQDASAVRGALEGRCLYVSLLTEVIPRAILERWQLSSQLLGASGGGQFLIVLPAEHLQDAETMLVGATRRLQQISGGTLRLVWSATENLGDWTDIRKRLQDGLKRWTGLSAVEPGCLFSPFAPAPAETRDQPFIELYHGLPGSLSVRWYEDGAIGLETGTEPLPIAHHQAPAESGEGSATPAELAARAQGAKVWGVLRGNVDQFAARLRRAQNIEEHLQVSVFFKQFFAGEVQVLCSQGEFWQKVSVLSTGGNEFAVVGAWDALLQFAREMQRLFKQSVEEFLRDFAGPEAKTISMSVALAPELDTPVASVYAEAARQLEIAKNAGRDSVSLLGRTIDWKQLEDAFELKGLMTRLVDEFGCSPELLGELSGFYRETDQVLPTRQTRSKSDRPARPWRIHRRLNRVLEGNSRSRDFQKARNTLLTEFMGRNQLQLKLKPSGRVALEWAKLAQES